MPTYEYSCDKCGHHFELVQPMSAAAITTCPKENCGMKKWGKGKVKRGISAGAGLIFKGSGFYITDYRSEGYKAAAKKDSSSGAGESSPSTKSDSASSSAASTPAPAKKSEAKPAASKS